MRSAKGNPVTEDAPDELNLDGPTTVDEAERVAELIPIDRDHRVLEPPELDFEWPEPASQEEFELVFGPNAAPLPVLQEERDPLDFDGP